MMSTIRPSFGQQARKAKTRGKILAAAQALFADVGYNATTIDQITHSAGVGRGTFYMHFTEKAELLREMYLDFRDGLGQILEVLGEYTEVDECHVCLWINRYIDFLVSQAPTMLAISTAVHAGLGAFRDPEHWHTLALDSFGSRIPAFRIAAGRQYPAITAKAQLILFQLEGFASACALDNWRADREATISELAKAILTFIDQTAALEIDHRDHIAAAAVD